MFHALQNHLQLPHSKAMGYHDEDKFLKALKAFKSKNTLIEWIDSPFYDFIHSPQSFYLKASEVLGASEEQVREELERAREFLNDRENYKSTIHIQTQRSIEELRSEGRTFFTLMYLSKLTEFHISNPNELALKPKDEVLQAYGEIIKEHYKANNGEIAELGKILGYSVKIWDKEFHFSPQGEVVEKLESKEILSFE